MEPTDSAMDDNCSDFSDIIYGDNFRLNESLFLRLKQNDPTLTTLTVLFGGSEYYAHEINWGREGRCIKTNPHLKKLRLHIFEDWHDENEADSLNKMREFCTCLVGNTSIRHLRCEGSDLKVSSYLSEFIEVNDNLQRLEFESCPIGNNNYTARSLAAALSNRWKNKSSLKSISFHRSQYYDRWSEKSALGEDIIEALSGYHNLVKLDLSENEINKDCCVAIAALLLKDPLMKLEELNLSSSWIDDECLQVLSEGFTKNTTMKRLDLSHNNSIGIKGWESLSSSFNSPGFKLEELVLHHNGIVDECAGVVGNMLASATSITAVRFGVSKMSDCGWNVLLSQMLQNPMLECLDLSHSDLKDRGLAVLAEGMANIMDLNLTHCHQVTARGWQSFFEKLRNSELVLPEKLDLSRNTFGDQGAASLADLLANARKLKSLNLSRNHQVTAEGWVTVFDRLRDCDLALENLDASVISICDRGAASLSNAFANNNTLKTLSLTLHPNGSLTARGWSAMSTILQNPSSSLVKVSIDSLRMNDEAFFAFARSLANNSSLRTLAMDGDAIPSITDRGWAALSSVLCNKSSIDASYQSNHTLEQLNRRYDESEYDDESGDETTCPDSLISLLEMNSNPNKFEVSRRKILESHFLTGREDAQVFLDMDLNALPVAFAWICRDDLGFSLLYEFLRKMPSVFEQRQLKQPQTKKRKHR